MANINNVIKIADNEVGYLEKKSNSQLDSKTANAGFNNYTKYGRDMHNLYPAVMDFPASWCDCFVDWCFNKAYGMSNAKKLLAGNFDDYTVNSSNLYKNKNAYYKSPKEGDQIFFKNESRICHTGLVYKVANGIVYTIEGNTSTTAGVEANGGCVAKKQYTLNNPRIDGYGRPAYNKFDGKVDSTPTKKKDKKPEKKDTVKPTPIKTEDKKPDTKKDDIKVKNVVNTAVLNIRKSADKSSDKVGTLELGKDVDILSVSDDWYKISKGYVHSDYIDSKKVTIIKDELNIRHKPDLDSKVIGKYKKGDRVKVLAKDGNWYLTPKNGWILGKFVEQ